MEQTPYSGMICAYLDGELDVAGDETLFTALAANPELRSEMREHLSIRSAVQSDVEAFTPPVAAAHTIFSSVGLNFPAAPPENKRKAFGLFWMKFWRPAVAAILLSAITGAAVSFLYEQKLGDLLAAGTPPPANRSVYVLQSAPGTNAETPFISAQPPASAQRSTINDNYRTDMNNPVATAPLPVAENLRNSGNAEQSAALVNQAELPQNQVVAIASSSPTDARNVRGSKFERMEIYPQFWAQVRGISTLQSSSPLPASGVSAMDNLGISAAWKLSDAFSIGIEGGRECYPLEYSGISEGIQLRYRQYAPVVFGGLLAQLSLNPMKDLGDAAPFLTVSGGGTEIGPYFRGTLGFAYPVSDNLSFMLGGDLSAVFYQFQQQSFQSWKSGLTYGLAFRF